MKVIFERQNILNATAPLMSTAANRSTMGATDGILIEAKNPDVCVFTTYDLEKGLRTTVETKVLEEGACIVNAQKFIQTMRVMDGDEVMLTVDEKMTAVFACGKSSHKMIALKAEDFPELPTLQSEYGFTVSEGILKDLLGKTMYAIGVSDQRPVLNGCYIEVEEGHLLLVACDSFKLAKCGRAVTVENNNTDGSDLRYRFILPVTPTHTSALRNAGNAGVGPDCQRGGGQRPVSQRERTVDTGRHLPGDGFCDERGGILGRFHRTRVGYAVFGTAPLHQTAAVGRERG